MSAEELIAELDGAGVDFALAWQNPAATVYGDDPEENYRRLREANDYVARSAARFPGRILAAGWSDPAALGTDGACRMIDHCLDRLGFAIVKFNPAQNRYPIDSAPLRECVDHLVARGGTPAFHFGSDTGFTPASGLAAVAERHPDVPVIAVHMGGGGAAYLAAEETYLAARGMLVTHPNVWFPLSAMRETHMVSAIREAAEHGSAWRRLMAASDAPYGHIPWTFGGLTGTFRRLAAAPHSAVSPDTVHGILGGNLRALARTVLKRRLDALD